MNNNAIKAKRCESSHEWSEHENDTRSDHLLRLYQGILRVARFEILTDVLLKIQVF